MHLVCKLLYFDLAEKKVIGQKRAGEAKQPTKNKKGRVKEPKPKPKPKPKKESKL